jgi:actin-like ATPase involved in cell morphogenesis
LAKAGKEIIRRLTAPEIREIVREEISAAIRPLEVKIEEMDKRLVGEIEEMDKRLVGEIASLRNELQYAPKVAVLEAKVTEIEKKLAGR